MGAEPTCEDAYCCYPNLSANLAALRHRGLDYIRLGVALRCGRTRLAL